MVGCSSARGVWPSPAAVTTSQGKAQIYGGGMGRGRPRGRKLSAKGPRELGRSRAIRRRRTSGARRLWTLKPKSRISRNDRRQGYLPTCIHRGRRQDTPRLIRSSRTGASSHTTHGARPAEKLRRSSRHNGTRGAPRPCTVCCPPPSRAPPGHTTNALEGAGRAGTNTEVWLTRAWPTHWTNSRYAVRSRGVGEGIDKISEPARTSSGVDSGRVTESLFGITPLSPLAPRPSPGRWMAR